MNKRDGATHFPVGELSCVRMKLRESEEHPTKYGRFLVGLGWRSAGLRADDLRKQIFASYGRGLLRDLRRRFVFQPQRYYSRAEVLVQLADEAVVATGFVGR